jgi:hypothetical protein
MREGWRYQHVQAIIVAVDQYAEAATGNREFFFRASVASRERPTFHKRLHSLQHGRGAPNAQWSAAYSRTPQRHNFSGGVSVQRGRDGTRDTVGSYLAGVVLKVRVDLGRGWGILG